MKSPGRSFWIWTISLGILIPLLCVVGYFATVMIAVSNWPNTDNISLQEVAKATGLHFPASARLEHGASTGFQDTYYSAKVIINRSDVPTFIASALKVKPGYSDYKIQSSQKDRLDITNESFGARWWKPDSIPAFYAIHIERSTVKDQYSKTLRLFVERSSSSRATIYIDYVEG